MAAKRKITITLSPELVRRVDRLAKATRRSRSGWIEDQLADALAGEEVAVQVMTDPVFGPAIMRTLTEEGVVGRLVGLLRTELTSSQLKLFEERLANLAGKPAKHGALKTKVQQRVQR